jgi:hypothetical protein
MDGWCVWLGLDVQLGSVTSADGAILGLFPHFGEPVEGRIAY